MSDNYDIDKLLEELFPEGIEAAFADLEETEQDKAPASPSPARAKPLQPETPRAAAGRAPVQPRAAEPRAAAPRPAKPRTPQAPRPAEPQAVQPAPSGRQAEPQEAPAQPEERSAPPVRQPEQETVPPAEDTPSAEETKAVSAPAGANTGRVTTGHTGLVKLFHHADSHAEKKGRPLDEYVRLRDEKELGDELEERDFRPIRQRRDGRTGLLGGFMYAAFVICLSVILACAAWMAASDVLALNKDDVSAFITLPEEIFHDKQVDVYDADGQVTGTKTVQAADMSRVASLLKDAGIIQYKGLFELYAGISDADVKVDPGTYELTTDYDYRALVKKMTIGSEAMLTTKITFPEGLSIDQIFQKLEDNRICSVEDLQETAANYNYSYSFLEDVPEQGDVHRLEGFLFPDTYEFYQGEQASSAINRFLRNFHYKLTADMLTQAKDLNLTLREVVTVASMIEKEAANDEERAAIAAVIYNRMRAGMPLQIDATVLYALGDWSATIDADALAYNSPYNTYLFSGLPAGPICNPGMASIRAALQPARSDNLYYALDTATGTHRFFNNYNEFAAFTATQDYG
ncbi:MAG: endolytic transglycosylase MltG [Clostridiales bacterium]|nr:endolytic transglycosylase MltG [Clostridiales bacterium]